MHLSRNISYFMNKPGKATAHFPRTLSEINNLQSFIKNTNSKKGLSLGHETLTYKKQNEEFNEFLEKYKEFSSGNYIDLTSQDKISNFDYSKQEIEAKLHSEQTRRLNILDYYKQATIINKYTSKNTKIDGHLSKFDQIQQLSFTQKGRNMILNEYITTNNFKILFLDKDFVTNITSLRRISHRRVLLFIGNAKGLIGYGLGRGTDYESAYGNAMQQAKNNLIYIEIDPQNTCPNVLKAQFNDVNLKILPMPYMRNWGNPILWSMLQYTGIRHCMFIIRNYRVNYLGLVSAYFMCMSQLLTPRKIAERDGRRIGEVYSRSMRNAELTY